MLLAALGALALACVDANDTQSNVKDLRVLGLSLQPPELMAPVCPSLDGGQVTELLTWAQPLKATALIADPAGKGRTLSYELRACASVSDKTCTADGGYVTLAAGTNAKAGEVPFTINPAISVLPDGVPLLQEVLNEDTYKGFGGVRMPLVLHLWAGSEDIYAQKLMVYSCRLFPDQQANVNPMLPGIDPPQDESWTATDVPQFDGNGTFRFNAADFSSLQEAYVVPSNQLTEVHLTESWKLYWYTDDGHFTPEVTGGTNVAGSTSLSFTDWQPASDTQATDVHFWFVVNDGRGGESWLTRSAVHSPP